MSAEFESYFNESKSEKWYPSEIKSASDKGKFFSGVDSVVKFYVGVADKQDPAELLVKKGMMRGYVQFFAEKYPVEEDGKDSNKDGESIKYWEEQLKEAAFASGKISNVDLELFNENIRQVNPLFQRQEHFVEDTAKNWEKILQTPIKLSLREKAAIAKDVLWNRETTSMALGVSSGVVLLKGNPEAAYCLLAAAMLTEEYPNSKKNFHKLKAKWHNKRNSQE